MSDFFALCNPADAIGLLHDATMSDKPTIAGQARLGKRLAGVIESWLADEKTRRTSPVTVLAVAHMGAIMIFFSAITNTAAPGKRAEIARLLREEWMNLYDEATKSLDETP